MTGLRRFTTTALAAAAVMTATACRGGGGRESEPNKPPASTMIIGIDVSGSFRDSRLYDDALRSEEHTSELQSLAYLVCRLLLEKKKKTHQNNRQTSQTRQSPTPHHVT